MKAAATGRPGSVASRIQELPCLDAVDTMLVSGVGTDDVAGFIFGESTALGSVPHRTLARELVRRRQRLQEPREPTGGRGRDETILDELRELEGLYLAQRDRVDGLILKEHEILQSAVDARSALDQLRSIRRQTTMAFARAGSMIYAIHRVKVKFGLRPR